jgi:hypothetical protein
MDEKYVRELCCMRNMDAKDGSQVMMDEKYGSRMRLDEKYGSK